MVSQAVEVRLGRLRACSLTHAGSSALVARAGTVLSLRVEQVDPVRNLIYVKGHVPGNAGGLVQVTDARRKPFELEAPPPFPTFMAPEGEDLASLEVLKAGEHGEDPNEPRDS